MQISVTISGLSPALRRRPRARSSTSARVADEAGIDQLVMTDHLAIGPRTDRYPFAPKFPYPPEEPWLEPLTVLAAFAAATSRVRLGTGVLIGPARPALVVAKTVATLDVLSRGRVDLGIGTGWQREEFTDPGLPVRRSHRADGGRRSGRAARSGRRSHRSRSRRTPSSFTDLWCEPRPVQARLPIWFSGPANDATVAPGRRARRRLAAARDPARRRDRRRSSRCGPRSRERGRDPATLGCGRTSR